MKCYWHYAILATVASATAQNNLPLAEDCSAAVEGGERGIVTPAFENPIHARDASSGLFSIKSSGRYYLADDFITKPLTNSDSFITVSADNVTFNLNTKTIAPIDSTSATGLVGITVNAGRTNVRVMNGTIRSLIAGPISHLDTGVQVGLPLASTVYGATLQDIVVIRPNSTGITFTTANDVRIHNCNCNSGNGGGLSLTSVNNFAIENSEFNNNGSTGILLSSAADGILENSMASSNSGTAATYGLQLTAGSTNVHCSNIIASSNSTTSGAAIGISVASNSCSFYNCRANGNTSSGGAAKGFEITGSSCTLINCQASNNSSSSGGEVKGFHINNANNNRFVGCVANSNSTTSVRCDGFLIEGTNATTVANNNEFEDCTANKNSSNTNSAIGFRFTTYASNNIALRCKACGNGNATATGASPTVGFEIHTNSSDNVIKQCIANGNVVRNTANANMWLAGYTIANSSARNQIIECEAIANHNAGLGHAYGINIQSDAGNDNSIRNCYLAYNATDDSKAIGFFDETSSSTALLLGNVSVGHGKCLGTTLDASLQWADSTPTASQNYYFQHNGTGVDPRNVIQEAPAYDATSLSTAVRKWQNISIYS